MNKEITEEVSCIDCICFDVCYFLEIIRKKSLGNFFKDHKNFKFALLCSYYKKEEIEE